MDAVRGDTGGSGDSGSVAQSQFVGRITQESPGLPSAEHQLNEVCGRLDGAKLATERRIATDMTVDEVVAYALSDADRAT